MSIITVKDAAFSYDGKASVFSHLNCEISDQDIFCILGPNGIGKSTFLKALMNLHALSAGVVELDGTDIRTIPQKTLAKQIAFIPQTYQFAFPYRVLDVVLMGRTPHLNAMARPSEEDIEIAVEAIETLRLEPLMYRACSQLSGGQMQLVMLARALAQEARFLMLDEPTSHLDYGRQMQTLDIIEAVNAGGRGVIMTTHHPDHAFMISNKVAVMEDGTFVGVGTPDEMITEERLYKIYGIKVHVIPQDMDINRKVCIPVRNHTN